mmetsp:Transcript_47555/g.118863  ORF Transcript_47555/g.118863 Transcript_47555/m.118863 type:complete len:102 (-) Transcript_47555:1078-1383(-)
MLSGFTGLDSSGLILPPLPFAFALVFPLLGGAACIYGLCFGPERPGHSALEPCVALISISMPKLMTAKQPHPQASHICTSSCALVVWCSSAVEGGFLVGVL